jgi:hypothetical protein
MGKCGKQPTAVRRNTCTWGVNSRHVADLQQAVTNLRVAITADRSANVQETGVHWQDPPPGAHLACLCLDLPYQRPPNVTLLQEQKTHRQQENDTATFITQARAERSAVLCSAVHYRTLQYTNYTTVHYSTVQ